MLARGFYFLPWVLRFGYITIEPHGPTQRRLGPPLALVLLLCSPTYTHADVITIDASRISNTSDVGYQPPNPTLFGQTFTAPLGAQNLNGFDFRIHLGAVFPEFEIPFNLRGYVARWDRVTSTIVGSVLYTSDPRLVSKPHPRDDAVALDPNSFEVLSFNTEQLPVLAGQTYVSFVTAFGMTDPVSRAGFGLGTFALSFCGLDFCPPNTGVDYEGGHFVFGEVAGPLPSEMAFLLSESLLDAAFRITFDSAAPIPEPGTILLLSAGAIVAVARRRNRRTLTAREW